MTKHARKKDSSRAGEPPKTAIAGMPANKLDVLASRARVRRQIRAIAAVTFQELIREKILWSSFLFGLLCVALAYLVSRLSFADNARIALDFGMAAISLVGGLIAVVMGSVLIAKEVRNRTHYLVLTKPVWRWQFVLGRVAGLFGVLAVNAALMGAILAAVFLMSGGHLETSFFKCLALQVVEFGVLSAVACVFSVFTTSTLAAVFASGIWVAGHAMTDIKILAEKTEPYWMRPLLKTVSEIFPDLTRFDVKAEVSHSLPVTWGYFAGTTAYAIAYMVFALAAACFIFSRKEL